jgi:hypothetical protein
MIFERNALSLFVTVAAATAFGVLYRPDAKRPGELLTALDAAAGAAAPAPGLLVALAANVCVDLIAPAADVLTFSAADAPRDVPVVTSPADARAVFLHHFAAGAAGERSCTDAPEFARLVAAAGAAPGARRSLGGNAALMGRKLARLGAGVILGGHIGPDAAALLPPPVRVVPPGGGAPVAAADAAAAGAGSDEVHLILEYPMGAALGGHVASRANRFILTADLANADIAAAVAGVVAAADAAGAHALVVAGLHMLEPLAHEVRSARLAAVAAALQGRAGGYVVHVELASSADRAWTRAVADALFPVVDSVGFNEVEAAFLFEALGGQYGGGANGSGVGEWAEVTSTTGGARTPAIASLLRFVFEAFPSLSRLHFHSLPLHVVAHRPGGGGGAGARKWRDPAGAAAAGSVTATTEACGAGPVALASTPDALYLLAAAAAKTTDPRGPGGTGASGDAIQSLSPRRPVATWAWAAAEPGGPVSFALAPVAACRKPRSTVGLGDAISAAGLAADVAVGA